MLLFVLGFTNPDEPYQCWPLYFEVLLLGIVILRKKTLRSLRSSIYFNNCQKWVNDGCQGCDSDCQCPQTFPQSNEVCVLSEPLLSRPRTHTNGSLTVVQEDYFELLKKYRSLSPDPRMWNNIGVIDGCMNVGFKVKYVLRPHRASMTMP